MAGDVLIRAAGVVKSYGATRALSGVNIALRRGEVHALLGGNGAGKSTLIRVLSREAAADSGELDFRTERVAVVHQELAIMPDLSVAENILLGGARRVAFPWGRAARETRRVLGLLGLDDPGVGPDTPARDLKLHQLQLIEIGRALSSGAGLILLDEPTASLTVEETDRLFRVLRSLAGQGIGFVLVSHRMHEIRQVADVVTVLRDGRTVIDARPLAAIDDQRIVAEMFGEQVPGDRGAARRAGAPADGDALSLHHPASGTRVGLAPGTVFGLAGAAQGPAALTDALLGLTRHPAWTVEIGGRRWRPRSPRQAAGRGIGFVSGDRAAKGTFPTLSIRDNAVVARQVIERRIVRAPAEAGYVRRQLRELGFPGLDVHRPPSALSGGTLQKVLLARWLDLPLRALVLEEPTRGVDVRTKADLYRLIHTMAESGLIVIWWSTEHAELLQVADRILTFTVTGAPNAVVPAAEADEARLLQLTGTT